MVAIEKRTPHCELALVRTLAAAGKVRAPVSALAGAAVGFSFQEIVAVIAALAPRDF